MSAIVADSKGFFKDEKIAAKFINVDSGPNLLAALVGGTADVSDVVVGSAWAALKQDQDLRILTANTGFVFSVLVRPDVELRYADSPLPKKALDLKGKTVGVLALGSGGANFVRALAAQAGLDPERDLQFVAIADPAALSAAFKNGQVDAMVSYQPLEAQLGASNYKVMIDGTGSVGKEVFPDYVTGTWGSTAKWIANNAGAAMGFCRAMHKAQAFILDPSNLNELAQIIQKHTPLGLNNEQALAYAKTINKVTISKMTPEVWARQSQYQPKEFQNFHPDYAKYVYQDCALAN